MMLTFDPQRRLLRHSTLQQSGEQSDVTLATSTNVSLESQPAIPVDRKPHTCVGTCIPIGAPHLVHAAVLGGVELHVLVLEEVYTLDQQYGLCHTPSGPRPLPPPLFDGQGLRQELTEFYRENRRQPGEPILVPELQFTHPISQQCAR